MAKGMDGLKDVCAQRFSQLDVVSNNIANLGTPGFKVEHLYPENKGPHGGSPTEETPKPIIDFSQGILQQTNNVLDVAIQGEGFFVVETKAGLAYTRKGNFTFDKDGRLVTHSGDSVLGEAGPIKVTGRNVNIDNSGTIMSDNVAVGILRIVTFDKPQNLARRGDGLFVDNGDASLKKVEKPDVRPGHLESSNVNAIREMVEMIDIQRSFESYHKAMGMMEDMDKLSTSRVGKLA